MTKFEIETNIETTVNGTEKIIIQTIINIIKIFFDTYAVCTTIGAFSVCRFVVTIGTMATWLGPLRFYLVPKLSKSWDLARDTRY